MEDQRKNEFMTAMPHTLTGSCQSYDIYCVASSNAMRDKKY